jgi:hypothetical protein
MSDVDKKTLAQSVQSAAQRAWQDVVATGAGLEEDFKRRFAQFVERSGLQHGSEEIKRTLALVGQRLRGSRAEIEQRLDETLHRTVAKVRDPLIEELAQLRQRAEQLGQRIEQQLRRQPAGETKEPASQDAPPAPSDETTAS